ncbi:MAG TPA: hypothetical protein VKT77_22485 [Chthonomonadaceae bacterium]|nr:hypothetical protein [Chthonomonadaceae bacterium]
MKQWYRIVSLAALTIAVAPIASVAGRPVEVLTPEQLWKQADVVVIGKAQSSSSPPLRNSRPNTWTDVHTVFTVEAALKGKAAGKTITLQHYRYHSPEAEITEIDGPVFVKFDTAKHEQYLLFLKAPRGLPADAPVEYQPLTGQMDPRGSFMLLVPMQR